MTGSPSTQNLPLITNVSTQEQIALINLYFNLLNNFNMFDTMPINLLLAYLLQGLDT